MGSRGSDSVRLVQQALLAASKLAGPVPHILLTFLPSEHSEVLRVTPKGSSFFLGLISCEIPGGSDPSTTDPLSKIGESELRQNMVESDKYGLTPAFPTDSSGHDFINS